jgi:hypothetical protein
MKIFKKHYYAYPERNYNKTYISYLFGFSLILIFSGYNIKEALSYTITFGEIINWFYPFSLRKDTSKEDIEKIIYKKTEDEADLEIIRKEASL